MPAIEDESDAETVQLGRLTHRARQSLMRLRPAQLFDDWMFAETEATLALAAWRMAPTDKKAGAYASYLAALDREGEAAGLLGLRLSPAA